MDITEKNEDNKKNAKKTDNSKGQNESTKLKILCLHGYRQTSTSFYEKTGAFRKIVGKKCEMKYINAPHLVPDDADQAKESFEKWLQTFLNIFFNRGSLAVSPRDANSPATFIPRGFGESGIAIFHSLGIWGS